MQEASSNGQGLANPASYSGDDKAYLLIASEAEADRALLRRWLAPWYRVVEVPNCGDAIQYLGRHENQVPVAICDITLPDGSWKVLLEALNKMSNPPCLVVAWPKPDAVFWGEALNLGAWDVLAKPFIKEEVVWVTYSALVGWKNSGKYPLLQQEKHDPCHLLP